jgi:hypothetical protein
VRIPADLRLPDSVKEVEVNDDFLVVRASQEQTERDAF